MISTDKLSCYKEWYFRNDIFKYKNNIIIFLKKNKRGNKMTYRIIWKKYLSAPKC